MLARVTTNQVKPEQIDNGIRYFKENVAAIAKTTAGFMGSYLLVDRKNGKVMGVVLFDTEENLKASDKTAADVRSAMNQASAATTPGIVEIYEVAAQLPPS